MFIKKFLFGDQENEESENMGNFLKLMKIRTKDNKISDRYFLQKEKFFRYITTNIIMDIQLVGIYSSLIDETQDLVRHEQVSFIICYIDSNLKSQDFIGFFRIARTDGKPLTNLTKMILNSYKCIILELKI